MVTSPGCLNPEKDFRGLRGGLLFLFLDAAIFSFSDLNDAGSDRVGARYFLPVPEVLLMLSDLGIIALLLLCRMLSGSWNIVVAVQEKFVTSKLRLPTYVLLNLTLVSVSSSRSTAASFLSSMCSWAKAAVTSFVARSPAIKLFCCFYSFITR